jgi:pimeloyl-ACP methyl ester carboxylesterase
MLNAGLIHRAGPNRLYVRIARALAAAGYPALRFDLSGRGDSDVRRDGSSFLHSSVAEARAVMDFVQKTTGFDRFVLMGICSGAINSLQTTVADQRVVGAIALDGPAYPTLGYHLRRIARRALRIDSWWRTIIGKNRLGRRLRGDFSPEPADVNQMILDMYGQNRQMPPKSEAAATLHGVLARGARLFFIFSGSWGLYNYQDQFRHAFPQLMSTGNIRVEYVKDADHTFTELPNQARLVALIGEWFQRTFPARGGVATSERASGVAEQRAVMQ